MQEYADIYLLQSHSTCFVCHSTHHQEPIGPRWREVAVPVLQPVPEAAVTVFVLLMMGAVTPETCKVTSQ